MNNEQLDKVSFPAKIVALSFAFILFSIESTFTILSILLPVFLIVCYFVITKQYKKIELRFSTIFLILVEFIFSLSSLISIYKYNLELKCLIQLFYQLVIFAWYFSCTNFKYNSKDIDFIIDSYILIVTLCCLIVLCNNLLFHKLLFAITSFTGHSIDKNFFGAFSCIAAMFCFKNLLYKYNRKKYFILFIIIVISLFFSNSRATLISIALGIVLSLIFYLKNRLTVKKIIFLLLFLTLSFFSYKLMIKTIPSWMYNRYFVSSYHDDSNKDRVSMWNNSFSAINDNFIIGYGPGILPFIPKYSTTSFGRNIGTATISHNTFIDFFVYGGLLGGFFFILFLLSIFYRLLKRDICFLPVIFVLLFNSFILGASKAVFFWNGLIIFSIIGYNICLSERRKIK